MTVQQYSCETGKAGYWQLSESTRKSNLLQMLLFTKAALSPQLFNKEPDCWFSWGLNQQPLAQCTGTYPIELTRQLEVMSLSIFPISLVAVALSLPILTYTEHLTLLSLFSSASYWSCTECVQYYILLNKRWMPMAFYTTTYLWKVAPLYPWGTPPFLKKFQ